MPKKIIVAGYHRNAGLAEQALTRHIRTHKATEGVILARRNDRGIFSSRGRNFTFALTLPEKKKKKKRLYRLSIGITYPRKKEYISYTLQHWQGSPEFSDARKADLKELTIQGLEKHLAYPRARFWFNPHKSIGVENPRQVYEDPKLKGIYELTSDEDSDAVGKFDSLADLREFVSEEE